MKLRALLGLFVVTLLAMAIAVPINADTSEEAPPKKVYLCHFDGHEAGDLGHAGLDGDYVIANTTGGNGPDAIQRAFCVDNGGQIIRVSERAVKGHRAQALHNLDTYLP